MSPSSQQIIDAADALDREYKRLQGVMVAASLLRDVGAMQGRIDELSAMNAAAQREADSVNAELSRLKTESDDAKQANDIAVQAAKDRAAEIERAATETANSTKLSAAIAAENMLSDARAGADKIIADANIEAARVGAEIRDAKIILDAATEAVKAKQDELARLEEKIGSAKKAMRDLLES